MANASIRLGSKRKYDIEVNDKGECISFDITDPELILKYDRTITKLNLIRDKFKKMDFSVYSNELEIDEVITERQRAEAKALSDFYNDMRNALDEFLGKDACYKIFGDSNYLEMFDDLLTELKPHFVKMGISSKAFKEEIEAKYSKKDADVF